MFQQRKLTRRVFFCGPGVLLGLAALQPAVAAKEYGVPVHATLQVIQIAVQDGQEFDLQLILEVNSPWKIYADPPEGMGFKLELDAVLPRGVQAVGEWVTASSEGKEYSYHAGKHEFTRKLKVSSPATDESIVVNVTYQACNPELCLPPETIRVAVLLQSSKPQNQVAPPESSPHSPRSLPAGSTAMACSSLLGVR